MAKGLQVHELATEWQAEQFPQNAFPSANLKIDLQVRTCNEVVSSFNASAWPVLTLSSFLSFKMLQA